MHFKPLYLVNLFSVFFLCFLRERERERERERGGREGEGDMRN